MIYSMACSELGVSSTINTSYPNERVASAAIRFDTLKVFAALAFSFAMRYHSFGENQQTLAITIHLITPQVTLTIYPDTEKRYKVGYI
jgi:hypothetical protein